MLLKQLSPAYFCLAHRAERSLAAACHHAPLRGHQLIASFIFYYASPIERRDAGMPSPPMAMLPRCRRRLSGIRLNDERH